MTTYTCINIYKNGRGKENAYALLNRETNQTTTMVTSVLKDYIRCGAISVDNLRINSSNQLVLVKQNSKTSQTKPVSTDIINRQVEVLCNQFGLEVDYSGEYACSVPKPVFYGYGRMSLQTFTDIVDGEKEVVRLVLSCDSAKNKNTLFEIEITDGTRKGLYIKDNQTKLIAKYFTIGSRKLGYFQNKDNYMELIDLAADAAMKDRESNANDSISTILPTIASWCGVRPNIKDLLIFRCRTIEEDRMQGVISVMNKWGDDSNNKELRQKAILACAIWKNLFSWGVFKIPYHDIDVKAILG